MKQFNLDEYRKNPSMKVVTRDGRPAKIIYTELHNTNYNVVAVISERGIFETVRTYSSDGRFLKDEESCFDLFFESQKKEGYIIMNQKDGEIKEFYKTIHPTREDAEEDLEDIDKNKFIIVKVEWED